MLKIVLMLMTFPAASAQASTPPDDAVGAYTLCVARSAEMRFASDPEAASAEVSAISCDNLLGPAVNQVLLAAAGDPKDARRRVAALLELQARREALRRVAIVDSYSGTQ